MQTPWGDLRVCDAHVHFFSHQFFRTLAKQRGDEHADLPELLGWEAPDRDPVALGRRWAGELDRHGVSRAAIIASVPGDADSVATAVAAFPDRFAGFFMCDPTREDAVTQVRTAFSQGLRTVCLFPAMQQFSLRDTHTRAVVAAAADYEGTAVFIHSGVLSVGVRKKLGLRSRFDLAFSNPVDIHSLAMEFEQLPFIIPHFGAGYLREALMVCDLCPNVYLDTSSTNSWIRYLAPEVTLREVFRRALDVAGAERLLFGTDSSFFPRGWNRKVFDVQSEVLFDLGVSQANAALILGGNFDRLMQTRNVG